MKKTPAVGKQSALFFLVEVCWLTEAIHNETFKNFKHQNGNESKAVKEQRKQTSLKNEMR